MAQAKRLVQALLLILLLPVAASAAAGNDIVARWYAALAEADAPALDALMTDDAVVVIEDLDVVQNKAEFLASMEQWKESVADATIRHRPEGSDETVVLVCYDFPANDMMIREAFTLEGGKVAESRQSHVADDCDAF